MPNSPSIPLKIRQLVAQRAKHICEYCRCPEAFSTSKFSVEHILPRSLDGDDELANLAFACQGCNNIKFTKIAAEDPETGQVVPLFHPREQDWKEHFAWDSSLTQIVGLTPTGRASVEALKLNRTEVQNLRGLLFLIGEHPPIV